jgi:hypothetical protein
MGKKKGGRGKKKDREAALNQIVTKEEESRRIASLVTLECLTGAHAGNVLKTLRALAKEKNHSAADREVFAVMAESCAKQIAERASAEVERVLLLEKARQLRRL